MSKKITRKRWIRIGTYSFDEIVNLAKRMELEVITAFKPSLCVDIHFKGKGTKENFEAFEANLTNKGHEVFSRCPKTGFQF